MILTPEDEEYGNPYDNEKKTDLINNYRQAFKDGYFAARGNETYHQVIGNYIEGYKMVNCLAHALNLRNQQLEDYNIVPTRTYSYFPNIQNDTPQQIQDRLVNFFCATGLKVEECDPIKPLKLSGAWKVAYYLENNPYSKDFHFLVEIAPGIWSSKVGYTSYLENLYMKEPPIEYSPKADNRYLYVRKNCFMLLNPNANPNNPYVQGLADRLPKPEQQHPKLTHCIIEGKDCENSIYNQDPLLFL